MNRQHAANIAAKGARIDAFLSEHLGDLVTVAWLDSLTDLEWAHIGVLADEATTPEESRPVVRALVAARRSLPADPFAGLEAMS